MKLLTLIIIFVTIVLAVFAKPIYDEIRWRRWRALPNHNPYKRGDSE